MIASSTVGAEQHDPPRLLAFHCRAGYEQWTPLAGAVEVPALVYEVTETIDENGSSLYEDRIFDAATSELIHERPYQSTFIEAFARWWTRETELDPPEELLSRDHDERADETTDERTGE